MINFELADYLRMKEYLVYDKSGIDIEAYLLEITCSRPINYEKLNLAAKKEGFVLKDNVWINKVKVAF